MNRFTLIVSLIAIGALLAGPMALRRTDAGQKQEYVTKADRKTLVEKPLHGVTGKKVNIERITLPSGFVGGKHYHPGPVFVYVMKGALTIDEEGQSRQTFQTGHVYEEPIGRLMQARNMSATEPTELLIFQVSGEGEPLMYRAE
jgi:quercetin dioxygenase-like cupin family protein